MAWNWNLECDWPEHSNYLITRTPSALCSSANIDEKCGSCHADDSGYFTEPKPALTQPAIVEQSASFPPLNLEISEETSGGEHDRSHTRLNECRLISDSSSDYINRSLGSTDNECRLNLPDVTNIYSPPGVADRFADIVHTAPEDCSFTYHSSCDSVHGEHSITCQLPVHVDFISLLSHMPCVVAVILRHVSDDDLCRMCCVSHSWRKVVCDDRTSRERRQRHLQTLASNKENAEVKACVARTMTSASRPLHSIQKTHSRPAVDTPTSLQRCRRYWEIGSSLERGELLRKCPRCESPARTVKDRATCTSNTCGYDVCINCENSYHAPAACRQLSRRAPASIGSRASKKRLERLCRR